MNGNGVTLDMRARWQYADVITATFTYGKHELRVDGTTITIGDRFGGVLMQGVATDIHVSGTRMRIVLDTGEVWSALRRSCSCGGRSVVPTPESQIPT